MKKFIKTLTLGILTVITALTLLACAPSNLEKAEKKMKDKGYSVVTTDDYGLVEGCEGAIVCRQSGLSLNMITALYFEDAASAKAYFEEIGEKGWREGKWVIAGDAKVYEDFIG